MLVLREIKKIVNGYDMVRLRPFRVSIYIYKEECLSVRYAFSPCDSYRHQTFHGSPLGPRAGQEGVGTTNGVEGEEV